MRKANLFKVLTAMIAMNPKATTEVSTIVRSEQDREQRRRMIMGGPRTLNQRQKRKRWRQVPQTRPK